MAVVVRGVGAGGVLRDDGGGDHLRELQDGVLHVHQVDAVAASLHLVVAPPAQQHPAVGTDPAEVAGGVGAAGDAVAEDGGDGGVLGRPAAQVALEDDGSGDVDLALAVGGPAVRVEHVDVDAADAPADGQFPVGRPVGRHPVVGAGVGLGGPVQVVERHPVEQPQVPLEQFGGERLPAEGGDPQGGRRSVRETALLEHGVVQGRYGHEGGDALFGQPRDDIAREDPQGVGHQDRTGSRGGGAEQVEGGQVEGEGGLGADPVVRGEPELPRGPQRVVRDVLVREQDALGPAGAAGGEQDVAALVGRRGQGRGPLAGGEGAQQAQAVVEGLLGGRPAVEGAGDGPAGPGQGAVDGQECRQTRVADHPRGALRRVRGVEGCGHRAGPQHRVQGDDGGGGLGGVHADPVARGDALGRQPGGQRVDGPLQPGVRPALAGSLQGGAPGVGPRGAGQQGVEAGGGGHRPAPAVGVPAVRARGPARNPRTASTTRSGRTRWG
ncbi:hypothetical protein STENM223S_05096 [Streptomyces tendae]